MNELICPFREAPCIRSECAIWADDMCAMLKIVKILTNDISFDVDSILKEITAKPRKR